MVIQNGTIVDGLGRRAFQGDVVVEGERIVDVIEREASHTAPVVDDEVFDATGLVVAPGFIDAHAHSDAYLVLEPDAPSKISQGVTTEVNGQCGGSAAPRFGEARLSSDWAALLGERLTWRSMAEYRATIESTKIALNTVQFVGHNTLRSSVVGYAGRVATEDERRRMARLLEESLDAGAWGLTTGLIYQPGKYADFNEVLELTRVAAAKGGLYATHMRSEGDQILESIDEVLSLVRLTGIRAEISHLKTSGARNWHKIDAVLEKMESAIDAGLLLGSDRYPYCAAGTDLDVVLPDWAQEGAALAECRRLADPTLRARMVDEINASGRDWSTVMIGGTWSDETKALSGRRVKEILESQDVTAGELVCSILERDGCKTGAFFFGMSEENLDKIYARPWIVPGSDASIRAPLGPLAQDFPHPRAYGTMPMFYQRVRARGVSREETIARMTSIPARRFGLCARGVIEKGAFADLVVFDEATFKAQATYAAPHQFSTGVRLVMVNGGIPYRDGVFTSIRTGRFLERSYA